MSAYLIEVSRWNNPHRTVEAPAILGRMPALRTQLALGCDYGHRQHEDSEAGIRSDAEIFNP
jgi:hypothetical protein